jgi:plasmid stabilization system protein ParE
LPRVLLTPRAVADLEALKTALGLPPSAAERVQRSLRILERFPLAGRELAGERWQGARFLIGPWPWMVIVYVHDTDDDAVYIVAIHDGRSAAAATGERS